MGHDFRYLLTYLLTNLLTPWNRVFLERLIVMQLVKKYPLTNLFLEPNPLPRLFQRICTIPRPCITFHNKDFCSEELAPHPTPKLEGHPLLAVCNCLFNIFTVTLHTWRPFLPSAI